MGELRLDRWLLPEFEQESDSQIWKIAGPGIRNRIQKFWNKIDVGVGKVTPATSGRL